MMSASLLRNFFRTGRNLSTYSDDEIIALRESARLFIVYCDDLLSGRVVASPSVAPFADLPESQRRDRMLAQWAKM